MKNVRESGEGLRPWDRPTSVGNGLVKDRGKERADNISLVNQHRVLTARLIILFCLARSSKNHGLDRLIPEKGRLPIANVKSRTSKVGGGCPFRGGSLPGGSCTGGSCTDGQSRCLSARPNGPSRWGRLRWGSKRGSGIPNGRRGLF